MKRSTAMTLASVIVLVVATVTGVVWLRYGRPACCA